MDVLYKTADLIAIHKPAGLSSIPAAGEPTSALRQVAEIVKLPYRGDADPRVRAVHRLDKDTSGVLLFALHRPAQQQVSHQFQNNKVVKQYLAIVVGCPDEMEGTIDAPIMRSPRDPIRMIVHRDGKRAVTNWKVLHRFRDFALLQVFPQTGKTHQIRVHMAHAGHPLAVDPLYGVRTKPVVIERDDYTDEPPKKREPGLYLSTIKRGYREKRDGEERPLIGRLTLHAERLQLTAPDGSPIDLKAEPPKDFRAAVNQLTKFGR
jgi:23S rRNA pseudouridine955/2504/2580 synthase/23S rRNA pseudouridine1911/1915/1917 synthase